MNIKITLLNVNKRKPICDYLKSARFVKLFTPGMDISLLFSPRLLYPKSWLWPEDYAATLIQKTVRQYFVQREEEVQEMRDFWKKLDIEQSLPEIDTNPFLAKKFASQQAFNKK